MKDNYFKLLDDEQKLKENGGSLSREKRIELAGYQARIADHFRWEQKDKFIEVMVDFLDNNIDVDQYIERSYELDNQIEKSKAELKSDLEKLRAFEPDPRSKGFAILLENLFSDLRIFEPDPDLRDEYELSEENVIKGIQEFLPKIREY